mmetsp:Transcript_22928/g.86788  ORF Transcript_22928/g.86788 Transcript_22928/m.86788 type:complete len:206 (-) Transcript_22928:87-704(-)
MPARPRWRWTTWRRPRGRAASQRSSQTRPSDRRSSRPCRPPQRTLHCGARRRAPPGCPPRRRRRRFAGLHGRERFPLRRWSRRRLLRSPAPSPCSGGSGAALGSTPVPPTCPAACIRKQPGVLTPAPVAPSPATRPPRDRQQPRPSLPLQSWFTLRRGARAPCCRTAAGATALHRRLPMHRRIRAMLSSGSVAPAEWRRCSRGWS